MNTLSTDPTRPSCTAFLGHQRIAFGGFQVVAQALAGMKLEQGGGLLVFDDATGSQVDYPWPADWMAESACMDAGESEKEPASEVAPPSVGRPRLGVVAREVTLLPRHWEWLASQRGGASAALRRLVDEARKSQADLDAQREGKERAYRFMGAIAGALPDFEEASRALFAGDSKAFADRIRSWPGDVQVHLSWLARDAFATT